MDFSNANITESGIRIKQKAKEHNMNQDKLAKLIGYESRNEVSKCWNGKKFLPMECYVILSKEWNVRIEWLLAIDDNETILDELKSMSRSINKYSEAVMYLLSSRGYKIKETEYYESLGKIYDSYDKIPNHARLYGSKVYEISANNTKRLIIENELFDLVDDFFTLIEKRIKPYERYITEKNTN